MDLVLFLCGSGAPTPKSSNKGYFFQPEHVWKSLDLYYCRESSLLLGPFCTQLVVLQNSTHPMHSNHTGNSFLTFTTLLYLFCMWGGHRCAMHVYKRQRTTCRSQSCPSTMWAPGIEPRSSGLMAMPLTSESPHQPPYGDF